MAAERILSCVQSLNTASLIIIQCKQTDRIAFQSCAEVIMGASLGGFVSSGTCQKKSQFKCNFMLIQDSQLPKKSQVHGLKLTKPYSILPVRLKGKFSLVQFYFVEAAAQRFKVHYTLIKHVIQNLVH